jgi:hypothetical protein
MLETTARSRAVVVRGGQRATAGTEAMKRSTALV